MKRSNLFNFVETIQTKKIKEDENDVVLTLYTNFLKDIEESWQIALAPTLKRNEPFIYFLKFLSQERKNFIIYPPVNVVFSWSQLTPFEQVKVLILGQYPYSDSDQEHGLAFSCAKGRCPPSLRNIFLELESDIPGFETPKKRFTLDGWAKQGVLLLNSVLTTRAGQSNSHKGRGWEIITNCAIKTLSQNKTNIVFMLWGKDAQEKTNLISKKNNHCILKAAHPSSDSGAKFFGCKHFSKCNSFLREKEIEEINWKQTNNG